MKDMNDLELGRLQRELEIDLDALDEALIRQPQTYFQISESVAKATSHHDHLKAQLKQVDAGLYRDIRNAAAERGEKVTEAMVESAVEVHPDHVSARDGLIRAKELLDTLVGLKEAFMQRSYALKDLAALWIAGYYTDSAVTSGNAGDIANTKQRRDMAGKRRELASRRGRVFVKPRSD